MSDDFRAKLRSYENRLENEHNDPEPEDFEECRHCEELTEKDTNKPELCGDCLRPYGKDEDETIELLQDQIGDLEMKVKDQAARIAELQATITGYQTMYPPKK